MTNSPPQLMPTFARLRRARSWPLLWLVPIGVLSGMVGGALMNAINGWLSPNYFSWFSWSQNSFVMFGVFYFDGFTDFGRWLRVVLQGMLEGMVFGVIFSVIYTTVVITISRAHCPLRVALCGMFRSILLLGLTSFLCGLNSIVLAQFLPSNLQELIGVPMIARFGTSINDIRFVYVWGSIWGIYFGGIVAVIVGCIWFSFDWRRYKREKSL